MKYILIIILLGIPMMSGAVERPTDDLYEWVMTEPFEKQTMYGAELWVGGEPYVIGYCPDAL